MVNQSFVPGISPTWFWYIALLISFGVQFASILLKISMFIFIRGIGLQFSCFVISLSGFSIDL